MFLLFLVGCKSGHPVSSVAIPDEGRLVASSSSISTTNVYYKIERGPRCAIFIPQSVYEMFPRNSEDAKVVVINGHFPPPAEMLTKATTDTWPLLDYRRRDMSLIDDTGRK
jgi:hypothetical protein